MTVIQSDQQQISTPTVRRVARRSLFWVLAVVFILIVALVTFAIAGSQVGGTPLSPTNPAPAGAMALAEVLRQQGVTVTPTSSLRETRLVMGDEENTTLLIYDDEGLLSENRVGQATDFADHIILVDPSFNHLQALAPEVAQAGFVDGELESDCAIGAVERAGSVSGNGVGFRLVDAADGAQLCLGSGNEVYSLIQLERDTGTVTVLGTTSVLSNEFITHDGNAALALGLLGERDELIWYLPTFADVETTGTPTIAALYPDWVTPVMALLALTVLAAALWRGRRFGPLIVENLPVVVRASETMQGRARLYGSSSARLRALDWLRVGTIQRIAVACGLPRVAGVEEVISAVSSVTGRGDAEVRRILVDAVPSTDSELVRLSDDLITLERTVLTAVRPA